ncbi:TPA: hypothetical protein ACJ3E3_000776, partial [Neisseria meningitidis]
FRFFEFQVTSKPPFPQKRESRNPKLQEFIKMTETQKTGFLRKQESGVSGLEKPFFPISFRTDRPRFPPARE